MKLGRLRASIHIFCRIPPVGGDILLKMTSDLDLLRQFARGNSQDAFAEIVRRHLNLVYSAALRQVRSPQLAEEVAQSVFADLARVAATPSSPQTLTPWLYAVTRRTSIDAIRKESRRQLREQTAMEMNNMNATANDWTQIEPLLDDAMAALDETDRSAILLRYFENKNLREVGEALGASEDAAQKRVSRAVERLREFFSKSNVTIGAGGLAVLISANAVQSAPMGLAATISAAAVLAGTAVHTSTVIAATKVIAMTTLQKTLITATVAVLAGAGFYEAHRTSQLRDQAQTLQQQQAPMAGQIRQLQRERDDATNRLAGLRTENAQLHLNSSEMEILKLRAEVTQLKALLATTKLPLERTKPDGYLTMDQLRFSGYSTPQAAFKSMRWAAVTGDFDVYTDSLATADRQQITKSQFMVITNVQKTLSGLQVLAEKQLGDRAELKVMEDGDSGSLITIWPFIQIGSEWKMHGNEIGYYKGWETNNLELNEEVPKVWVPSD